MFSAQTYIDRRNVLKKQMGPGVILFLANEESPMNYAANTFEFWQDSTFLYYFGLNDPGLVAVIDVDSNQDIIFGDDLDINDIVWMGPQPTMKEKGSTVGVSLTYPKKNLSDTLTAAIKKDRTIHYLPPYRPEHVAKLKSFLGTDENFVNTNVSKKLIAAVAKQRSIKSREEIEQIEIAHATTYEMHVQAMKQTKAGMYERDIAGLVEGIALSAGGTVSFPIIFSIRGETLHNRYHGNQLKDGDLVVHDSGAKSSANYCADITRTFPVSGKFTAKQKEIYEIVYKAQTDCIENIKPGVKNLDLHLNTSKVIAQGLKDVGLMKGNVDAAVAEGAHALFFPHGLGHMMGMDVHDMENLGENNFGYDEETKRSKQFGLSYLRLSKKLEAGNVITVEPGIYFIPPLASKWKSEGKFTDFINYDKVEEYFGFGGVRLEDDVEVTKDGHRIIGKHIPKTVDEIEEACK